MEKVKQILKSKVLKFGGISMLTTILTRAVNLVSAPIFARILTTEEYGRVDIFFTYANIGYIILGIASSGIIAIAYLQFKDKIQEYIACTMSMAFINFVLIGIVVNIFYGNFGKILGFDRILFNILLVYSFSVFVTSYRNVELNYVFEYKKNMYLTMSVLLMNIILSICFVEFGIFKDNALARIIGAVLPNLASGIWIFFEYQRKGAWCVRKSYIKYTLRYALPMVPHTLSLLLLGSADRVMIKKIWGASCAGIYAISYTVGTLLYVIIEGINKIYIPISFRKMEDGLKKDVMYMQKLLVLVFCIIASAVLCISPELILIFGGREYKDGKEFVLWIVFATIVNFLYTIYYNVEYYYKKTIWIAIGTLACAILNIVLNYLFLPIVGYQFGAASTVVSYLFLLLFHMIIVRVTIKERVVENIFIVAIGIILFCETCFMQMLLNCLFLRICIGVVGALFFCGWLLYAMRKARNDGVELKM